MATMTHPDRLPRGQPTDYHNRHDMARALGHESWRDAERRQRGIETPAARRFMDAFCHQQPCGRCDTMEGQTECAIEHIYKILGAKPPILNSRRPKSDSTYP